MIVKVINTKTKDFHNGEVNGLGTNAVGHKVVSFVGSSGGSDLMYFDSWDDLKIEDADQSAIDQKTKDIE